jgi:hypothetical protein
MLFVKKLPWTSLSILFATHGIFGWLIAASELIADADRPWVLWLMGAIYIVFIDLALTAPLTLIQSVYSGWLKSDTRAFISVIVGAFLAVLILCWIHVFVRILVLLSAGALVRLDLQVANFGEWKAFSVLVVFSLVGYGLGIIAQQIMSSIL